MLIKKVTLYVTNYLKKYAFLICLYLNLNKNRTLIKYVGNSVSIND